LKKKNIRKLNLGFQTLLQCHVKYYVFCHVTITYFVEVFEDLSASLHRWIWRYSTGIVCHLIHYYIPRYNYK